MRSWRPRRPAARLRRRIFSATPGEPSATWLVGWLVPATACALLTLMVFKADNSLPVAGRPLIGTILSDENYAAFAGNGILSFGTVIIVFIIGAICMLTVPSISTWIISTSGISSASST